MEFVTQVTEELSCQMVRQGDNSEIGNGGTLPPSFVLEASGRTVLQEFRSWGHLVEL